MNMMIKLGMTAAVAVVLAWPLLFWGKPALPESGGSSLRTIQPAGHYRTLNQQQAVW
jgi:hypothetical protein